MSDPKLSHPKCYGCGHNFFKRPAVPEVNGKPVDGGKCEWCLEELNSPPDARNEESQREWDIQHEYE